jgi:hypothetical protein
MGCGTRVPPSGSVPLRNGPPKLGHDRISRGPRPSNDVPSDMPPPLTALEQRLFERLEAAMMDSDLGGDLESIAMLAAVNDERSRLGKARVTLRDVQEAERAALGHVDYPYQFVKRGAELVHEAVLAKPA